MAVDGERVGRGAGEGEKGETAGRAQRGCEGQGLLLEEEGRQRDPPRAARPGSTSQTLGAVLGKQLKWEQWSYCFT